MCQARDTAYDQSFFSYSADGHVSCWELDAEQNCDICRQVVRLDLQCVQSIADTLCMCAWQPLPNSNPACSNQAT